MAFCNAVNIAFAAINKCWLSRVKSMRSLLSSIVYLTLDTLYKVGKPFILLDTHAMFTDMVRGSLQLWSRVKVITGVETKNSKLYFF